APQALVYKGQLFYERHTAPLELVEERVGVQGVDVRVPTSPFVSSVIWTRKHVGNDGLEHDADPIATHLAVVHVVVWPLEVELEAHVVGVIGRRRLQVFHDEGRTDRNEISSRLFAGLGR